MACSRKTRCGRGVICFLGAFALAAPVFAQQPQPWGPYPYGGGNPWQAPNAPFGGGMPPYPPMQQPPGQTAPQPPPSSSENREAMERAERHFQEGMKALEEAGRLALQEHSGVLRQKGLDALKEMRQLLEKMERDLEQPAAPTGDNYQNL